MAPALACWWRPWRLSERGFGWARLVLSLDVGTTMLLLLLLLGASLGA